MRASGLKSWKRRKRRKKRQLTEGSTRTSVCKSIRPAFGKGGMQGNEKSRERTTINDSLQNVEGEIRIGMGVTSLGEESGHDSRVDDGIEKP